jgi:hypothetical protein
MTSEMGMSVECIYGTKSESDWTSGSLYILLVFGTQAYIWLLLIWVLIWEVSTDLQDLYTSTLREREENHSLVQA